MKIKKRFVAFMMAILMVLTSITIQYRKSEAATAKITINFDSSYQGKTVKVAIGTESFESEVVLVQEEGSPDKYLVTGDIANVEQGNNQLTVKVKLDENTYSNETYGKTIDVSGEGTVGEINFAELSLVSVNTIYVTGDLGLYEAGSIKFADNVIYDSALKTLKKSDNTDFDAPVSFTATKNLISGAKENVSASVTLAGSITAETAIGYIGAKITIDPTNYTNYKVDGVDSYKVNSGVLTITDNKIYAPGTTITLTAYKDGLKYENQVILDAPEVTLDSAKWKQLEKKVSISNRSGSIYTIVENNTSNSVVPVNNIVTLDISKTYSIKVTANNKYKKLDVTGVSNAKSSISESEQIQTVTANIANDATEIKIEEKDPTVTVEINNEDTNIIPEINKQITVAVNAGGFNIPGTVSVRWNADQNYALSLDEEDTSKVKLSYRDGLENGQTVSLGAKFTYTDGSGKEQSVSSELKDFTIAIGSLIYSKDFKVEDATSVYPVLKGNNLDKIYFKGEEGNNGVKIKVNKTNTYNQYRYRTNGGAFGGFSSINENGSTISSISNNVALQMLGASAFGMSNAVGIVKDNVEPTITVKDKDGNDNVAYEFDGTKISDFLKISAEDNKDGSGVKYTKIAKEDTKDLAILDEIKSIDEFDEGNELTYYIYAVDNVGNIAKKKITVTVDTKAPTINTTDGTVKTNYKNDEYTYINNSKEKGKEIQFEVSISDANLNEYKITLDATELKLNPDDWKKEPNEQGGKTVTGTVKIATGELTEGLHEIAIGADDTYGHEAVKKTVKFVVDNTAPTISSAKATPVKFPESGDFSNLKDKYIAYNANSKIVVEFSDDNIDIGNAVTSELVANNEIIPASPILDKNNEYSASYSMGNNKLAETLELDKSKATITVTDKAGNVARKNITYDETNALVDAKTKKVVLIKTPTTLNTLEVINNDKIFVNSVNGVTGSVQFANTSDTVVDTDFFNVKVVKSADTADTTGVGGTAEKDGTKFAFHIDAKDKLKNDEAYKVVTQYYDVASYDYQSKEGVTRLVESPEYVYDNVAPKLNADFSNANGTITYTLTEKHPDFKNFDVKVETAINNEGNIANSIAEQLKGAWTDNNGTTKEIELPAEGKYKIIVTPKDKAANKGDSVTSEIVYDKTAPTLRSETAGVLPIEVKTAKETKNTDYSKFDETKAVVTVHAYDLVADSLKKSVFTLKDSTGKVITVTGDKLTETKIVDKNNKSTGMFTESFEIDPNFKGSLSFVLEDSNKNVSDEMKYTYANGNLKGIVVEDGEKHESVSEAWVREVNASAAENGIYNEDIKLNLYAEDMYSGLSSVSFVAMNKDDGAIIAQYSEDIESRTENSGVQYTWSKNDQVISALKKNEGNNIELWFSAQDNAGHKISAETKTVKIDVTAPKVTVTYDNNSPVNEKYFNATRTATIEVKDYNFISSGITLDIKKNGAPMNVAPNFSTDRVVKKDESGKPYYTYVMTLPFAEDGDYDFTVSARDAAGNVGTLGRIDSFTIDKTNPDMSIAFDNNNPYSGQYYGDSRTATITIKEHNFNASDVKVNVTASVDGSSVSAPSVSAFSTSGDVHTASVTFNGDADYTISASCVDLAGNEGNNIEEQSFTVDQTAPEIKITGVKADESYTGSVSPVVTVTDGNYDTEGVTVNIVGGKHGKSKVSSSVSDIAHGQTYSFADLQHTQDNDDYYTLTAKAVDKAGHETEETIAYKVNRFGSVYVMNDALQAAVDQYYATSSDKYAIIEQNVDELDSYTVSYSVDNEIVNLEENKGYKVSHKTNKEDWQEYEYKLDADTFSKEGVYNISISSKDTAGNASDNKSKNVEMEFCIDNTKPSCIISGVEENQKFDKGVAANIVVEAYDNIKFGDMQISVNGNQIKSEKDMTDGKVSFTIDPAKGDQTLKVVCHDAAGNETVQEVHFTFNMGVLNSGSPVAIIIIVIAVVAAAAVGFFLIAKKKKNGK